MTLPDPLSRLDAALSGDHPRTLRFRLPWIPTSKKNRMVAVRRGAHATTVPDAKVTAEEDAIRAMARAALAFHRGRIGADGVSAIQECALRRMTKGNGIGTKRLERFVEGIVGECTPLFSSEEVQLEVKVVRGKSKASDFCEIVVRELGPAPTHKRARISDTHNVPAVIADALQGAVYADDAQVAGMGVQRTAT